LLLKAGLTANPQGDELVPMGGERMQGAKEGVEEDPEALKAVSDFGHRVREANLFGFSEGLEVAKGGAGPFTEVIIHRECMS
jgi:hypothetical protein